MSLSENDHELVNGWARQVAREEVASLAGLILRRLQEEGLSRSPERNHTVEVLNRVFGEALNDFGGTQTAPGDA